MFGLCAVRIMAAGGKREAKDPLDYLTEAWRVLRLSVRCSTRVPTWDAVMLTAASPAQANLYQLRLEQAKMHGTIAKETVVLAVPDPEGRRIGSGAATANALRALACHLQVTITHTDMILHGCLIWIKSSDSQGLGFVFQRMSAFFQYYCGNA